MFKLVEERRAWQPVIFPGLTEDGQTVENKIEMQFVLLSTDANLKLLEEARELTVDTRVGEEPAESDGHDKSAAASASLSAVMAKFGMKIIRDWRLVYEANDDPIKFEEANLARLFNVPGTFDAALRAYRDAIAGGKDARSKN